MAIGGPSALTGNASSAAVTSITCDAPAGIDSGWTLFWHIVQQAATVAGGSPTGFNATAWHTGTTTGLNSMVYYRDVQDGDAGTTFTSHTLTSARTACTMVAFNFLMKASPKTGTFPGGFNGTTATAFNPITPTHSGAVILAFIAQSFASGVTPGTAASGNTTIIGQFNSSTAAAINVLSAVGYAPWTSGAFTPTGSNSAATTRTIGLSTAMRPGTLYPPARMIGQTVQRSLVI